MKYLIWGTGSYCKEKFKFNFHNPGDEIIGFVDREKGTFYGKEIILPLEIGYYEFDKIAVFSWHYLEIIKELISMGIKSDTIIPGIAFKPLLGKEIQLMTDNSSIHITDDGFLDYGFEREHIIVKEDDDWEKVKRMICSEKNADVIKKVSVNPVSRAFGIDRGKPIDRYYIERFIYDNLECIKGDVLEMGEDIYTKEYGADNSKSYIFVYSEDKGLKGNTVYGNLESSEGLPREKFDCIIFTQVFNFIYDVSEAVKNSIAMLKKNGTMLLTVAGNTPVSRYDMDRWGHYWNFTYKSVERLCNVENVKCDVYSYGNCKVACGFLQGMSVDDFEESELDYCDSDYPIVICAHIKKL